MRTRIARCAAIVGVLRAVNLDDQLLGGTGEVDDVAGDRNLPAKSQSHQPVRAKLIPELQFGVGHDASHRLGVSCGLRAGSACRWSWSARLRPPSVRRTRSACPMGAHRAVRVRRALYGAPLCPAGHLPHKGGDRLAAPSSPFASVAMRSGGADDGQSPPLWGRCPAGQRGALSRQPVSAAALTASPPRSSRARRSTGSLPSLSWMPCARSSSRMRSASAQFFVGDEGEASVDQLS